MTEAARKRMVAGLRWMIPASLVRRFVRQQDGAAAIEFAFVALPFLALTFAILETALVFFAGQTLEAAAAESGRLIMTGQAQTQHFDKAAFKQAVCDNIGGLFDCKNNIYVDVRTFTGSSSNSAFSQVASTINTSPIQNGKFDPTKTDFNIGGTEVHCGGQALLRVADLRVAVGQQSLQPQRQQAPIGSHVRLQERALPMSLRAMNATTLWLPRLLKRFAGDRRGVSAVEFALLAPVMIALYLGMVEVSDGIGADRKVSLTVSTLANLTAQYTTLSTTDMTNILDASSAIITPYSAANLSMTVTCLDIDKNKNVTVKWSVARNTSALSGAVTIPTDLRVPSTQLILAKVSYAYTPTIGYTISGTLNLSDRMYMAPRINAPSYNGVACAP